MPKATHAQLNTHCQAAQLSAMTKFVNLSQKTQARTKKCKFFGPKRQNIFLHSSHACTHEFLSGIDNVGCSSSAFEVLLLSVQGCSRSKVRCIAPPTNMPQLSAVWGIRKPLPFFVLLLHAYRFRVL